MNDNKLESKLFARFESNLGYSVEFNTHEFNNNSSQLKSCTQPQDLQVKLGSSETPKRLLAIVRGHLV